MVFVGSKSQLLAVNYNEKYFSFMVKTAENLMDSDFSSDAFTRRLLARFLLYSKHFGLSYSIVAI